LKQELSMDDRTLSERFLGRGMCLHSTSVSSLTDHFLVTEGEKSSL
jgi:hypothetical protein